MAKDELLTEYGQGGRLGVLVPPANPTVEPEMAQLLPTNVAMYVQRLPVLNSDLHARLEGYNYSIDDSILGFGGMELDVIYYACTGASYLVGPKGDAELAERITAVDGAVALTAASAIVGLLGAIGAERVALLSPYPAWLTQQAVRFWSDSGLVVVAVEPVPTGDGGIYGLTSDTVRPIVERISHTRPDAILLSGTGMPTLATAQAVMERTGTPTLSSSIAAAWAMSRQFADLGFSTEASRQFPALIDRFP